ncbi:MAG: hypothetical protein K2G90_04975 [Muribaculaceae bacterium]|nr:hypothetical protein [Muribaculaceae bacterium]MDE6008542.1 hypothetical protein [Muribaculaceae bacterium]
MADISLDDLKKMLPDKAIPLLSNYISSHPDSDEALTIRGMKYWALGIRNLAIKDYHAALLINPDSNARQALSMANSILNFYNKDLLNP